MMDKHKGFRDLHRSEGCFVLANAWDAGSAKMLAAAGVQAIGTTSAGLAYALGERDEAEAIGLERALENIAEIVAASDLPVSADFENGYADSPAGVAYAIRRCAETGAAGASIEDLPGDPSRGLYDPGFAAERIAAAVEAARGLGRPFTVTARAESYLVGVPKAADDALDRLQRYAAEGADCVYAPGVRDRDEIRRLVEETGAPLNVLIGIKGMEASLDEMQALGVKRLSVGGALSRLAWRAVMDGIAELRDGRFTFPERMASDAEILRAMGK
ncbi:MAG: isocitrate lyase/phosphoenolpyruvate mutase family protein [Marivibrio sp.]|uniref:isocitrate lyase/PEP mutase family protein n=1 Tax=Marivibrio sp. TaxID=2039719 RepID=UPI0032EFF337